MPEPFEVENARHRAEHHPLDRTIVRVACDDPLVLRTTSSERLGRALTGATVTAVEEPDPR